MTQRASQQEWTQTIQTIDGLWPDWDATDAERDVFERRLRPLRQTILREAIQESYTRTFTSGRKPRLSLILECYRAGRQRAAPAKVAGFTEAEIHELDGEVIDMRDDLMELNEFALADAIHHAEGTVGIVLFSLIEGDEQHRAAGAMEQLLAHYPDGVQSWPQALTGIVWAAHEDLRSDTHAA